MDMPRGCFECSLREDHGWEGDWCSVSEGCDLIGETTRPHYCPLKSADEMMDEIDGVFNDRPFSYNHYQRTRLYLDVKEIIHKYCDK